MQINKETVREVMVEVRKAVETVARARGLTLKTIGCSYDPGIGDIRLRVGLSSSEVNGRPVEQVEFERVCALFYLKPEHYRTRITALGEEYEIVGFKPNASKRPIVAERTTDRKRFVFPATVVGHLVPQEEKASFAASQAARILGARRA